ncbi:hypothetical protein KAU88_00725 [Candidatus Bathyarchaeota archaeon]|nr:hypothetical protein [Candidatus Bathyarchaeota archaeon]
MSNRWSFEVFPEELKRRSISAWRILLALAYDGSSTMYGIKKKYGFLYPSIHRATKSLEELKWIRVIEERRSQKGGTTKVYGLTLLGLLHVLSRIPKLFRPEEIHTDGGEGFLPEEAKPDLRELTSQQDVAFHLLYCFRSDQVAENNRELLPLIFGKWGHLKSAHATVEVFSSMLDVAHVTLADYYSSKWPSRRQSSLHRLFAFKVYYNILKGSVFEYRPKELEDYDSFDYQGMIQQKAIAIFRNDRQLTALFKQICSILEKKAASLSKSLKEVKWAILS